MTIEGIRLWHKTEKRMIYPSKKNCIQLEFYKKRVRIWLGEYESSFEDITKKVRAMFSPRFTDKKDKMIFDEDIIEWKKKKWIVYWDNVSSGFCIQNIGKGDLLQYCLSPQICRYSVIIGNRWETPEIMKDYTL